ncbi:carbohydrate ABC transporter permease [Actinomadura madurae]|uniref:carbohydrate ABC transporter permease n=1 Tax=Actinomadura madurae TaxID=1993 RepID=UPI0020D1F631|nr:carbohydrate ABC transporter permease [Actinomadura madurae]
MPSHRISVLGRRGSSGEGRGDGAEGREGSGRPRRSPAARGALLGTLWSLVLFYSGLQVPFAVFLYAGFLRVLPREYEEAALIDGGGPLQVFWRVVFPLLRPVTGTVVILNAIFVWNDFLTPFLYLSGSDQQTIPVAVYGFIGQYVSQWNLVFAGLVIAVLPILIAYFVMQRHIIKGFAGGLKG